mmetsp:Transcript_5899/g.8054  ORF Transcript_5899/g.8054 Transcript_5899/m.8054 type:complete len:93 (+) Transcript_5899:1-279(+)
MLCVRLQPRRKVHRACRYQVLELEEQYISLRRQLVISLRAGLALSIPNAEKLSAAIFRRIRTLIGIQLTAEIVIDSIGHRLREMTHNMISGV